MRGVSGALQSVARSLMKLRIISFFLIGVSLAVVAAAQSRRRPRGPRPAAPRGAATRYAEFLHTSDKHKALACNACHKIPTEWSGQRAFPDVADFPDHEACVRCHRPQFFSGQAMIGTGPTICTICHLRAAPREASRFAFGAPNNAK